MTRLENPKLDDVLLTVITVLVGWFLVLMLFNSVVRFEISLWILVVELMLGAFVGGLLMGLIRPSARLASAAWR